MLIENKVAVTTSGASGIGEAAAKQYCEHGATGGVGDIDEQNREAVVRELKYQGWVATFVNTEVSNENDVKRLIEMAIRRYGGLDVLFYTAD